MAVEIYFHQPRTTMMSVTRDVDRLRTSTVTVEPGGPAMEKKIVHKRRKQSKKQAANNPLKAERRGLGSIRRRQGRRWKEECLRPRRTAEKGRDKQIVTLQSNNTGPKAKRAPQIARLRHRAKWERGGQVRTRWVKPPPQLAWTADTVRDLSAAGTTCIPIPTGALTPFPGPPPWLPCTLPSDRGE